MIRKEEKIFKYVELHYNTKRAHLTFDYFSPFEYEKHKFSLNNYSIKYVRVKYFVDYFMS